MYSKGISSKQDFDSSQNKLTAAESNSKASKAKHDKLEASIKKLEAEVEQAKLNLSYTKIYAHKTGKLLTVRLNRGIISRPHNLYLQLHKKKSGLSQTSRKLRSQI